MTRHDSPRKRKKGGKPRRLQLVAERGQVLPLRSADEAAPPEDTAPGASQLAAPGATAAARAKPRRATPPAQSQVAGLISKFELSLDAEGQDAKVQDSFFQRGLDERALAAHRNADEGLYPATPPWNRAAVALGTLGLATVVILAMVGLAGRSGEEPHAEPPATSPQATAPEPVAPPPEPRTPPIVAVEEQAEHAEHVAEAHSEPPSRTALLSYQAIGTKLDPEELARPAHSSAAPAPKLAAPAASAHPVLDEDARSACERAYAKHRYRDVLDRCGAVLSSAPQAVLDPDDAPLAGLVAHAYLMHGKLAEARTSASRIIESVPTHAFAYVVLGMAEQERGRDELARAAYERYLALEPQGEYAKDLRAILQRR